MGTRTASAKGRLMRAHRFTPDQIEDRRRDLAEAKIADFVEKILTSAPPLTDEQRTRLAELLKPVRGKAGAA